MSQESAQSLNSSPKSFIDEIDCQAEIDREQLQQQLREMKALLD